VKIKENRTYNVVINVIMILLTFFAVFPMVILFVSSFSSEHGIARYGYSFILHEFSLDAYKYLLQKINVIGHAYLVTLCVTAIGTTLSLAITMMIAYPISRRDYPYRKITTFLVLFTILFSAGLVPSYRVWTGVFHIKNTYLALILPALLLNGFNVLITRTYFANNVPTALIEAAKIDGAGEILVFLKIVLPISIPILATIGLMSGIAYWNDWYNGFIYVTDTQHLGIQSYLARIIYDLQYLSSSTNSALTSTLVAQLPTTTVKLAIAVIGVVPILIIYPFFQKYFVKGITIGSVKG